MDEMNLRRLDRKDLLELLIRQSKRIEELEGQLAEANRQLEERRIQIEETGNMAEAALKLNGVFEAAQNACQQYVDNITLRAKEQDDWCEKRKRETEVLCHKMMAEAQRQTDDYWNQASAKIQSLIDETDGLRDMLEKRRPQP